MPNQEFFTHENPDNSDYAAEQQIFSQALQGQGMQSTPESYPMATPVSTAESIQPLSVEAQNALVKVAEHMSTINQRIVVIPHLPGQEVIE